MFRVKDRIFRKEIKKVKRFLNDRNRFPDEVYSKFVNTTPRQSGNAKSNTNLDKVALGWKITGDYDYSGVLDRGLFPNPPKEGTGKTRNGYSTQAPKGMTNPTLDFAKKRFKRFIRSIR